MSLSRRKFLGWVLKATGALAVGKLLATEAEPGAKVPMPMHPNDPLGTVPVGWDGHVRPTRARNATSRGGKLFIQPDGPGTEEYFLKCHDLDLSSPAREYLDSLDCPVEVFTIDLNCSNSPKEQGGG